MKHLLSILLICSVSFTQELEVEGDLKVTGTVESATIDSLEQVIAAMQAQIDAMHADNQLETRMYTIYVENPIEENTHEIDIEELTGYNLSMAKLEIIKISDFSTPTTGLQLENSYQPENDSPLYWTGHEVYVYPYGYELNYNGNNAAYYDGDNSLRIRSHTTFTGNITIMITAQFQD